jgi:hypothetical protein
MKDVSESLAGRIGFIDLSGFDLRKWALRITTVFGIVADFPGLFWLLTILPL